MSDNPTLRERFKKKLYGLSEDMEDFLLEQFYHFASHHHPFYSSFYTTAVDMWQNGIDLSTKQLDIIEREYNKVKDKRMNEYGLDVSI